jgi:hypothetical protein
LSTATSGRPGGTRSQLAGTLAFLAVVVSASAGPFVARAVESRGATTVTRMPTTASRVVAAMSGPVTISRPSVRFEHFRARTRHHPTTTTTIVPATAPPQTVPRVVARVDVPPGSYTTAGALCVETVAEVSWPPGWAVNCEGSRSGLLGVTNRQGTHLFMRSGLSASFLMMVAAHEAGHAWDLARLGPSDIATWCAARGCDAAHFFDGPGGPGWSEPGGAEDWAEAWRICHGGSDMRNYIGLGPPSAALCALQLRLVES